MRGRCAIAMLTLLVLAWPASAQAEAWSDDVLDTMASVPVQDGGRIKPIETYANFLLLRFNGHRACETDKGGRISALEWLMDCLFYPEKAKAYPMFLVENAEVLDAIGVDHDEKRGRYSYAQLESARGKLFEFARQYSHREEKDRTPVQNQIVNLAINIREFERLIAALGYTRHDIDLASIDEFAGEGVQVMSTTAVLGIVKKSMTDLVADQSDSSATDSLTTVLNRIEEAFGEGGGPALIPPPMQGPNSETWLTTGVAGRAVIAPMIDTNSQMTALALLERMEKSKADPTAFAAAAADYANHIANLARERGEYARVPLEVSYYRAKFTFWSLIGFVACFLVVAFNWMAPNSNRLWIAGLVTLSLPTIYLIAGIVVRCIIRGRPPVSTLYESILFITATIAVLAIIIEWINRDRVALSLGAILGALGVFLANKYEIIDGADTMPSLVAVLNTNFWLATHVTTVTIGYAAGLLAAGVAHIFLLGKLIGFKSGDPSFYRGIVKLTYGIICFGLVFSVVGTVLGGIWANYSWGRFWGWDPKENGALMIVLWELAILHFRMGGRLRQFGMSFAAVFGGMIVAFSWFGVNLLGVGLHSYGFTSGVAFALNTFYGVESVVLLLGCIAWYRSGHITTTDAGSKEKALPLAPAK